MAVAKYEQRAGKLLFLEAVRDLRAKTMMHLYRERVVPTRIRHHYADHMMTLLDEIDLLVHSANDIFPEREDKKLTYSELYQRQQMQREALQKLDLFSRNVQTLIWCGYAKKDSIKMWSKSITHCETMIKSWAESDRKRWGVVKVDNKGCYFLLPYNGKK